MISKEAPPGTDKKKAEEDKSQPRKVVKPLTAAKTPGTTKIAKPAPRKKVSKKPEVKPKVQKRAPVKSKPAPAPRKASERPASARTTPTTTKTILEDDDLM